MKKILILEANPTTDLSLNDEIQDLQNVILSSRDREEFQIHIGLSVRSKDLQKLILDHEPNIIHFCGHGTGEKGLVFRDKKIDTEALHSLFELFKEHLECVVLNACYSKVQADEIVKCIRYVIGINQEIRDNAAIAFSIGFYRALGYGRSIEDAFKFGKNAIQLEIGVDSMNKSAIIIDDTRKFLPMNIVPELTITEEHLKPICRKKTDLLNSNQPSHCNLPHRDYSKFIGRELELQQLLEQVSPDYRQHITIVEGIGGVGKTTLVLEAAYRYLEAKQGNLNETKIGFDTIIFTSAKKTYLTPQGILTRPRVQETLKKIFRVIAEVLDEPLITLAQDVEESLKLVYQSLERHRTILIIDNMETITSEEQEAVISFLDNLPPPTQAILTSRHRIGLYKSIRLSPLSKEESLQLINQEAKNKAIKITNYQAKMLFKHFGGIPVALIYAVGQKAMGYSLKRILGILGPSSNLPKDLARFLFKRSVEPLQGLSAHKLLMSMTFFQTPPSRDALITVAGLKTELIEVEEGLAQLQQLSLIREEQQRFHALPITSQYALDELAKYPEFFEIARKRWIEWYLKFTQKYGGKDWQDWRIKYDYLDQEWENIASVLYWCANQDKYNEVKKLWQNIDHYIDLGCYWRTRNRWWKWLMKESDRRTDLPTYIKSLSERAWTLTLMGNEHNQREAVKNLLEAWKLRSYINRDIQAHIANHFAVYRITQKKYRKASQWLKKQEYLVNNNTEIMDKEKNRHHMCIQYYRGEINYRQNNFREAKECFNDVMSLGKTIGWQRFTNYAQNYLVNLLIDEGELIEAKRLLITGLLQAEKSREKRRIAHYQTSYAYWEKARANPEKAREWASRALEIFKREDMHENTDEIYLLLTSLQSE